MSFDASSIPNMGLWENLVRFAHIEEPTRVWQDMLACLIQQTHAEGAWLQLRHPLAESVKVGYVDRDAPMWLTDSWRGPEAGLQVQTVGNITQLSVQWDEGSDGSVGSLGLCFGGSRQLSPEEECQVTTMVKAVSTVAGQVVELRRTREHLNRVRHLYEVGQAIASTLDLDQVLEQSTARVTEVLRVEASTLILVDETRQQLVFKIPAGPAERMLREQRMPMDKGVAGWVATHGEPLTIPDVQADDRFYIDIDRMTGYATRSIMAVPLQVKGKTIGVLEAVNKTDGASFTPDDVQWLSILAPLVASAVENARLFTALREEHERIIAAEETVRHELARNLHDGPAQILAAMILNIDMARRYIDAGAEKMGKELNFLESLAQEANHEIRDLLFSVRPVIIETQGLTAVLQQYVERHQPHAEYQFHLDVGTVRDEVIPVSIAETLFVIIGEAVNNIQKHARAANVWIRLGRDDYLWVEVADDGAGFDVKQVEENYARLNSFGLLNMRERARLIDGRTGIYSPRPNASNGTLVRVEVPL